MKIADAEILILAGFQNSGPGHWQRRWLEKMSTARFVEQANWDRPDLAAWTGTIEQAVIDSTRPVVFVTHSLGGVALVHTAQRFAAGKVSGAFIVAPPDIDQNKNVPKEILGFNNVPADPLPFPSLLLASRTDPFCTYERAGDLANAWGSELHNAGDSGHINIAAGFGAWPEGLMMFTRLMQRIKA